MGVKDIYRTLGASNHTEKERELLDFYATSDIATNELLNLVEPYFDKNDVIYEPACGMGHIAKVCEKRGYKCYCTDLVDRGYGIPNIDFLKVKKESLPESFNIITNPPYSIAQDFVEKGMELLNDGKYMAMLLKLQFLEGIKRCEMFKKYPPYKLYVFSYRVSCAMNGDFEKYPGSAIAYGWYVWQKGFQGLPTIEWIEEKPKESKKTKNLF